MKKLLFASIVIAVLFIPLLSWGSGLIGKTQGLRLVSTGSVTLANMRLSLVNGVAFVDFSTADVLTDYIGKCIVIIDSAGKKAIGYIKAAGTGETYGSELFTDPAFDNAGVWTAQTGWAISGGKAVATAATSSIYQTAGILAVGKLLKISITCDSLTDGYYSARYENIYYSSNYVGTQTFYLTGYGDGVPAGANRMLGNLTATFTDISLKQVLTPSATGVTIVSTPGGTTYNWESIESGFNYNDAAGYTYRIYR